MRKKNVQQFKALRCRTPLHKVDAVVSEGRIRQTGITPAPQKKRGPGAKNTSGQPARDIATRRSNIGKGSNVPLQG